MRSIRLISDRDDRRRPRGPRAGFTLVEVMVSLSVLMLGVITAGGVMISVQRGANMTENRYQDFSDLRARTESLKAQLSTSTLSTSKSTMFPAAFQTKMGHSGKTKYEVGSGGLPNLVWVEMTVDTEAGPLTFDTYLRINE